MGLEDIGQDIGSPAHAGMVPTTCGTSPGSAWFPRPRGDGPLLTIGRRMELEVSPPTRGWSSGPLVAF